jgi:demethylmenaquinone methyltransferase/2-methoxy-6-polyprenyl-1,4-benzoquinol methylase
MSAPVVPHAPLTKYYSDPAQRETYVRELFDETAPWYEWANRFLSFGSGDWYRLEALRRVGLTEGMKLLDLASGTGPVARAAAELTKNPRAIVGVDPSIGMLLSGHTESAKVQAPAERLPLRSASVDRISVGFAMRHFADLDVVFRECHRVLKPGGKLLIMEITAPEARIPRAFMGLFMGKIAPLAIRIRTGSARTAEVFRYYWETTRDCVRPEVILETMRNAGFTDVKRGVELGIFSEYVGSV